MNTRVIASSQDLYQDPLQQLILQHPPEPGLIMATYGGAMYHATLLRNGQLGVCATLGNTVAPLPEIIPTDLRDPALRIPLISYYNALFNPEAREHDQLDIFSHLDFAYAGSIVMIGYFRPLVQKFDTAGIPLIVFDINQEDARLTPYASLPETLSRADTIIITSTTLVNNTFPDIIRHMNQDAAAYMLGPSTLLHPCMFRYPGIKALYGMKFQPGDLRVTDIITANGGTPEFSRYATKVCVKP